ncbi:MAG: hypothetical protein E7533_01025 [Ruminococcaceae bacterium]|nr:hypothetical protein [Oscillospiraceae bacterium]
MSKLYDAYISSYRMDAPDWESFLKTAGDIYFSPQVQSLEQFEQHFKINRLQHIRSVAYLSFLITRKLGLDYKSTARAATMHDLFYYDWREKDLSHKLHGYRHPGVAHKNAWYLCGYLNKKEEDIIKKHMWPLTIIPPRYLESLVVSSMDKYCATIEVFYSSSSKYRDKFHKLTGIGGEQ